VNNIIIPDLLKPIYTYFVNMNPISTHGYIVLAGFLPMYLLAGLGIGKFGLWRKYPNRIDNMRCDHTIL